MKRKLIIGLNLITLLFIISGLFILYNLNIITNNLKLKEHQEKIIGRYNSIIINLKGAQTELYRHQAGYSRDINLLVDSVLQLEDMLTLTRKDYTGYTGNTSCNNCHSAQGKVNTLNTMLEEIQIILIQYKQKISRIVTINDFKLSSSIDAEATKEGDEILNTMNSILHAALKMNEKMESFQMSAIQHATYSIVASIVVSLLLSILIITLLIRSITGPFLKLVKGIEGVSAGEYDSKVDIVSQDEIGFLAKTFNSMTDNLNRMTMQKESLMLELRELNSDLERRIENSKEELRITHQHMLHGETLSIVGTFASGVAHELSTPLSSIISYFRMIRERLAAQEQLVEDIEIIEAELYRCRNILRGMLNFARAPEKEKTMTDVNSIIRDILTLLMYQTEYKKKIVITNDLSPSLPGIMAIPGQLKQVFMNIIVNALQSMPDGGEISISTSATEDGKNIIVLISDTGCGIPENEMNRIFNPFYTNKKSGTGLGLSISYGIIKSHGGSIEVKSEHKKGTTFSILLPVS